MHTRQNELNKWLATLFSHKPFTLTPLAGDASFRRYFRLHCGELTHVVMDAPPDKEAIAPFISIGNQLATAGVHTPAILAVNHTEGFILLEDLGDQLLLDALSRDSADMLYTAAMTTLLQIQQCPTSHSKLPEFDLTHIFQELSLFREWFLHAYLNIELNAHDELLLQDTFDWLTTQITAQPQVFIHRDYHARNLMMINKNNLQGSSNCVDQNAHIVTAENIGVIDFQDAMRGPFTYDLVSLLKDCYIQWPREHVIRWLTYFYHKLPSTHGWSLMEFTRAFDLCGLQRHLKVLGIFCRLHLRDHKAAYLRDLPLTLHYVNACSESYAELQPFYHFIQKKVYLPFTEKNPS